MSSNVVIVEDDDRPLTAEFLRLCKAVAAGPRSPRATPTASTSFPRSTPSASAIYSAKPSSQPTQASYSDTLQSSPWGFPSTSQISFSTPSLTFTATSTTHALDLFSVDSALNQVSPLSNVLKTRSSISQNSKKNHIAVDLTSNTWHTAKNQDESNRTKRRKVWRRRLRPESTYTNSEKTVVDLSETGTGYYFPDPIVIEDDIAQTLPSKSSLLQKEQIEKDTDDAMDVSDLQLFMPFASEPRPGLTWQYVERYAYNNLQLSPKVTVELEDGDFMRIVNIVKNLVTGEVFLKGNLFRRRKYMNGLLEKKLNELCWILDIDNSDPQDERDKALHSVKVTHVVKRRALKLTNLAFPALRFSTETSTKEDTSVIESSRVLVCRWKCVCYYADAAAKKRNLHCEKALFRLRKDESDASCGCSDDLLRQQSRGNTIVGGDSSSIGLAEHEQIKQETVFRQEAIKRLNLQRRLGSSRLTTSNHFIQPGSTASAPIELGMLPHHDLHTNGVRRINENPTELLTRISVIPKPGEAHCNGNPASLIDLTLNEECTSWPPTGNTNPSSQIDLTIGDDEISTDFRCLSIVPHINLVDDQDGSFKSVVTQPVVLDVDLYIRTAIGPQSGAASCDSGILPRELLVGGPNPLRSSKRDHYTAFEVPSTITSLSDYNNIPVKATSKSHLACNAPALLSSTGGDPCMNDRHSPTVISLEDDEMNDQVSVKRLETSFHETRQPSTELESNETILAGNSIQRYTMGDGFCGGGGVSRGAAMAGLCVKWAFDHAEPMCETYHRNFPGVVIEKISAFDFATKYKYDCKVDVLHLSPPCQFYSPAHTTVGKNDEENVASSFVITELIRKAKPRIVTLENTLGLEQRHPRYLNAVVQQFTTLEFSIRWKVLDLRDFGVPQSRRRLVMIASCPGEVLPDFPPPTHSRYPEKTGLKPWTTINQTINKIPEDWPNHNIPTSGRTDRRPHDGNNQAKCITTSGGENNHHPSGERDYTPREYACLQTFPLEHMFPASLSKTVLIQQIGNSVPPLFYKCLAEHIVKRLKEVDGIQDVVTSDAQGAIPVDRNSPALASTPVRHGPLDVVVLD